jgi:deazaflavin-dependent oxidoreductase (nitroreductase family)
MAHSPRRTHESQAKVFRILNPWMRLLLHLPIGPIQARLLLLTFTGRKSGEPHTIPVSYVEDADGSLLLPGGGAWKWNLRSGDAVPVRLRGRERHAQPELIRDAAEIGRLLPAILAANPRAEQFIGVPIGADGAPDPDRLAEVIRDGFMLVRLRLV